ncbi:SRPBCC family protein [Svornostia abyssi]|uniref:SRPBCC family protein n=1 Tax=Svornostia abyssi TaxID=2898438 RepID=A0ABY5PBF7_9ACTN|nr:SRPBCC family protein [Parviterribacteraceae bacterium J379]
MGRITGDRTVDIAAPAETCFAIAADLERAPAWQSALQDVEVHERDAEGRPAVATLISDAKVRTITARWRLTYAEFTAITWEQERGDVKAMRGSWTFDESGGLTRATYALEVDPGRMLGLLLRGPGMVDKVRDYLLEGAADGLKRQAESA